MHLNQHPLSEDNVREFAAGVLRNQAPSTLQKYKQIASRLVDKEWIDYCVERDLRRNTAKTVRAAFRYFEAHRLATIIGYIDRYRNEERHHLAEAWSFLLLELLYPNLLDALDKSYTPKVERKKNSKRKALKGKPKNWREVVIQKLQPEDWLLGQIYAMTGCRPAETAKGIELKVVEVGLEVTIKGAKVSDLTGGGQPERIITVSALNPFAQEVISVMSHTRRPEIEIMCPNPDSFRKRFKKVVTALGWPELAPYCFRHQFSSDLKSANQNTTLLSLALGHRSGKSRSAYGHFAQGRRARGGSGMLVKVEATYPVREDTNTLDSSLEDIPDDSSSQDPSLG
ncbi:hypothetical protein DET50_1088 [Marinobacter pelagius]|uniref:Phage integrase family protein n=1 Tax=Marinobacter pelagius TaxID=379482 RepID=A0A366GSA0_9GAMM|nr:site-specific integrase [Marinobacter pelagius]RBP29968.1 hypothetical protein DET50_1088 [Marinobacter pelagius]